MANIQVLDAAGATQTVTYPDAGRSAATASSPVVLSTEDKASLDAIGTKLDTLQASVSGTDAQLPTALESGRLAVSGPLTNAQLRAAKIDTTASNITTKFRDAFEVYPSAVWNETKASGDLIFVDGNASAASYLVVSKDPLVSGTDSQIESAIDFLMPVELAFGAAMSQRTLGQEFSVELVDTQTPLATVADLAISSITQATTTLTVDTTLAHNLSVGKSIGIFGCSNPLANYPALVVASVPSPTQFTCTAGPGGTIASQTITNPTGAKGSVFFRERLGRAQNGVSQIFEMPTVTTASLYLRSEAGDALPSGTIAGAHGVTVGTTAPVQLVNSPYQYAFAPTTEYRIFSQADRVQWADSAIDALTQTTSRALRTQVCPDPSASYKLRMRAVNNKSLTVPNAQIVSAVKTGTTTATITTATPHGLLLADPVVVYGIRDQAATAFPNLVTATAVASVVDATSFTIVIGTAATVTSYGGYVAKVQGGNLMSALGANAIVAQSAVLSTLSDGTRQLVLTGSGNWAGLSIGDMTNAVGVRNAVDGATLGVDGPWKVANSVTTALTLVLPFAAQRTLPADFGSVNCGGAVIKRTCFRVSFVRLFDFARERVEMLARPIGDLAAAAPVVLQGGTTAVTGTLTGITTVTTVTTVAAVTSANLGIPLTVADVASAALTTTTTVAAVTPGSGMSYVVNMPVTAVTGTTPTLDFSVEESDDAGTNWYKVYDFPRITATGMYRSPKLALNGNRVRYVQTVAGTTPSFTRSVNRLQCNDMVSPVRQLIDRSVVLTTLNSATPSLNIQNCRNVQLVVNVGAITTTAPALQVQGSDDAGASWYAIGSPLTAVASSSVQTTVVNVQSQLVRALVSTAGVGVTAGYILIKGF